MLADWVKDFKGATGMVLDQGRKVVVYSGKEDYICNYLGGVGWTNVTTWKNQDEFQKATLKSWKTADGTVVGMAKSGGGLSFVEVANAGHMVPMDQPLAVSYSVSAYDNSRTLDFFRSFHDNVLPFFILLGHVLGIEIMSGMA